MRNRAALPADVPLAVLRRGGLVESVHRGRLAVCSPEGRLLDFAGDPEAYIYVRSSAKPFQAMPLVLSGAADALGLTDEELAVACASHHGEERHVRAVRAILRKAGLSEKDLQNGAHPPRHGPSAAKLAKNGEPPGRIHGNCSGKHAGMIATCAHRGWDVGTYRDPEHPLQLWILDFISRTCGLDRDGVRLGGDGCGAPAFAMPLENLAIGFSRFATGENLPDDLAEAARRLRNAMRKHPLMVSGTGGFDTRVMEQTELVVKGGADGVWAAGSRDGWGLALKISDGAHRAVRPVAAALLDRRGVVLSGDASSPVRDLHGSVVGAIEPLDAGGG